MKITTNLMNDIAHAPEWFHEAINQKPQEKILDHIDGNISYAFWKAKTNSDSLIVLVHGTGAHKKWWYPVGPKLNHKAHVIAIDLPGMGDSDFREKYKVEDFGGCVTNVIKAEKVNHNINYVYLVGHSLGGHVAGYVGTEEKNLINGLMIVDTFIRPPNYDNSEHKKNGPLRMIKFYENKEKLLQRFRLMPKQDCENDWYLRYIAEHSIKQTKDGWRWKFDDRMFTGLERLFGYKFSFECPASFVHGENSLLTSGKLLENAKLAYSDRMKFINMPGSAHHVPLDKPGELIDLILSESGLL
jgi:pimeloyl-ACP methyl ester carboxylesterase